MNLIHQKITLDTDNGHAPEIIERFNRIAKQYDLTELPILLQSWMDDQDIADFAGMLEERALASYWQDGLPHPVPPCPEGVPYDNHLVDCNCD